VTEPPPPGQGTGLFPPTRWTLVLAARERPEKRRQALDELIAPRWRALYVVARKQGLEPAQAEDAVQSFLTRAIEGDLLLEADPSRGKLRSFLRVAFRNHLANLHEHASAARRGGERRPVDLADVEALVASPAPSADAAFDRAWALELVEESLTALERELAASGQGARFEVLRALFRFGETEPYSVLATRLGLSVPQLKSFVHRSKARFRVLLRARVADTLDAGEDLDAELHAVVEHLAS
jgi:DNA-directed RNA polymerase specialized sigma24 family protein